VSCYVLMLMRWINFMIMNWILQLQLQWLSCLWHKDRQVRHSLFWHNAEGWRSRKTSGSRPCKVSVSSCGKNQMSRSRLGLAELQEGIGLGLVSDQKPNVSVSSRSRKLRSCLHLCELLMHHLLIAFASNRALFLCCKFSIWALVTVLTFINALLFLFIFRSDSSSFLFILPTPR